MANSTTFAMGKFGTVVPCPTATPLASELHMLGRLIGTDHPQGRAEARGIVERAENDTAALLAALRAVLPYAESRLEDVVDDHANLTLIDAPADVLNHSQACVNKAASAVNAAVAAIAAAEGRAHG